MPVAPRPTAALLALAALCGSAVDARRPGTEGCMKGADKCHGNGMQCGDTVVCCRSSCTVSALTCSTNGKEVDEDACSCEGCNGNSPLPAGFHAYKVPARGARLSGNNPLNDLLGGIFRGGSGLFHKPTQHEIEARRKEMKAREEKQRTEYANALTIDDRERTQDDDGLVAGYQQQLKSTAGTDEGTGIGDRDDTQTGAHATAGLRGGSGGGGGSGGASAGGGGGGGGSIARYSEAWYWMLAKWVSTLVVLPFFLLLAFKLYRNYAAHKRLGVAETNAFGLPVPVTGGGSGGAGAGPRPAGAASDSSSAVGSSGAAGSAVPVDAAAVVGAGAGYQSSGGGGGGNGAAPGDDTVQLLGGASGGADAEGAGYQPPGL